MPQNVAKGPGHGRVRLPPLVVAPLVGHVRDADERGEEEQRDERLGRRDQVGCPLREEEEGMAKEVEVGARGGGRDGDGGRGAEERPEGGGGPQAEGGRGEAACTRMRMSQR